jgi:CheY-like chemotaxis protein
MKLSAFSFSRLVRRKQQPVDCESIVSISPRQIIAVVGSPELRPPLEDVVGPGAYDVVFIDSIEGAHTRIAQTRPDRVILCCDVDDPSGFQLLSMLKADRRTRTIPATTYMTWPLLNRPEMM